MRNIFLLTTGMFVLGFDAYVVAGLLPEISTTFKISNSQAGQAVSIFTLCYALSAPIFITFLAEKPVRTILFWALAIFSVANGASSLAPNFSFLLIARAVAGIGAGLFSPMASATAASLVSEEKRGHALGMTLGGMSMGTVVGVPLGLLAAKQLGWQGTLWLVAIIGLIATIGIYIFFPNFSAEAPPSLHQRFAMMTNKYVLAIISITFLTSIASLGLYTYLASILQKLVNSSNITLYLWAWGIGGVVGSFSIGTLIDRTGRPVLLMTSILTILMLAMFSLPSALNFPVLAFLVIFLWGAMGWASQAPQQHTLLHLQPQHGKAAIALNSSVNYLGSAVGSTLGGIAMFAGLTPTNLPYAAGSFILIALFGQLIILKK